MVVGNDNTISTVCSISLDKDILKAAICSAGGDVESRSIRQKSLHLVRQDWKSFNEMSPGFFSSPEMLIRRLFSSDELLVGWVGRLLAPVWPGPGIRLRKSAMESINSFSRLSRTFLSWSLSLRMVARRLASSAVECRVGVSFLRSPAWSSALSEPRCCGAEVPEERVRLHIFEKNSLMRAMTLDKS